MADPNVKAAFDKFDADASGSLERGELLDVLHELGLDVRGDEEFAAFADALMEDYDSDGDGRLDFAEFEKLYNQCLATAESRAAYAEELRSAVSGLVGSAMANVLEHQEMEAAATKIQAVHKGKQARKELQERKEMEAAAVKIQAVHRGKQARKMLLKATDTVESAFKKFDTDGSGMLEAEELFQVLAELGLDVTDEDFIAYARALMEDYDSDGNGELDLEEFRKLYNQCLATAESRAAYAEELRSAVSGLVGSAMANVLEHQEMEAAATKIQAVHKGKQARKELQERKEQEAAAVKIQAVHRGKQARKAIMTQAEREEQDRRARLAFWKFDIDQSGSLELGELYAVLEDLGLEVADEDFRSYAEALLEDYDADGNGSLDYKEFQKFYAQCLANEQKRKMYAEELQRAVSGLVGSAMANVLEHQEMEAAATKIQAVHKGKQARKELQERQEMEAAAVKIQAVHRGKQARKMLLKATDTVESAFKKFDTDGSGMLEAEELFQVLAELGLDVTDEDFIAYARALMEDYDSDGNGELDLEEFRKLYNQCLATAESRAAYAEELRSAVSGLVGSAMANVLEHQEMEAAATKIQAVHKGKQARKELQERKEMEAAAVKIQAVHRGKQARKMLLKATDTVESAFKKFDTDGSGMLEAEELFQVLAELGLDVTDEDFIAYARALMEDYDSDGNGELDLEEFRKLYNQCLATAESRAAYAEELRSAVSGLVGSAMANVLEHQEMEAAATKIQAVHKGKQARKELQERKEMEAAAVKIQAVHRGKQARKMLLKATDTVESAFKKFDTDGSGMLEAEELFQVLAELGLDVTDEDFIAYARALMEDYDSDGNGELDLEEFRKLYNQCLATAESRAAYAEELRSAVSGLVGSAMANVLEHQEMEAAATKIQAVHKGKQARKELQERKEMEAAAVKIQAVHRGKQARKMLLKATDTVESAFKKFDTDGSGMLEAEELFQVLAELGLDVTDEDFIAYARALMEDYDSDGNGELDLEEFRKLYNQCLATAESRAAYAEELRSAVSGLVGSAMANVLEHQEMEAAATKIQAVHKGKQARKELQERKEMEAAAVKIQAVHRGKQARKMLLKATDTVESAFKKFDTDGSGMLEAEELFQVLAELGLDVTDEDFIAYARALMEDYDSDGNGELDLEEFRKLYNQCLATAESRAAYAEELRSAVSGLVGSAMANVLEHQEMEAAATKIQAVHKGKQARKELQERKEMEAAAVKIQAVHRGKMRARCC